MKTYAFFMITSLRILRRMRNFSYKSCRGNPNTHFMVSNFFPKNRAIYEIMCKKYCRARQATDGNKIQHIYVACWMSCGNTEQEFTE